MPEGDAIHRAARRLQPLVGQRIAAESPNPRGRATRVAERIDGRRLESVEAVGKNLVLRFEGGIAVRSHLRMSGRWTVRPRGGARRGSPWLVLAGDTVEAALWNGPVLELHLRALARLGPDILARPPRLDAIVARLRSADQTRTLGESLLDQSLVAGIGNMWLAETLWAVGLSPWRRLGDTAEAERRAVLVEAARSMSLALERGRGPRRSVYRRVGRPCPRCGTTVASRGQGDANRIAYWCPGCQH
ncbi:MAG TPA: DNA-formamidopyrimidine glycosylase family protein [Gaiellaceae bacterium]|jgi:endonuclease-8